MNLTFIIIFNLILIILFSLNVSFLIFRYYRDITLEETSWIGQVYKKNKDYSETDNDPVIQDQIKIIRQKFYLNFILVEISLITFFTFWCIMLFYKIPIV